MREIKFRGWSKTLGMSKEFTLLETVNSDINEFEIFMQYVGKEDINGKKIYERDIVKDEYGDLWQVGYKNENCGFILYGVTDYGDRFVLNDIEIVGNIYENPELLEVE